MSAKRTVLAGLSLAVLSGLVALLTGCFSLDPFLFKGEKLTGYQLDGYTGERECDDAIDSLGPFDQSTYHPIVLTSGSDAICAAFLNADSVCNSTDTLICYFHGTGPHNDYYWARIRLLQATGNAVFAVDFRGYGMSTGTPTEDGIYEDGHAALAYIRQHLGNPRVVIYGFSLGSLAACEMAATDIHHRIISLVLEAPLKSVETLVQDGTYLNLPGSYVTTYTGNNAEKIKSVSAPLLWLHGTQDEMLNRESNGLPVWNSYQGVKGCYYTVTGAGHATVPQTIGYNAYIGLVRNFIKGLDDPHLTCGN
jgi:pimeloyl-ACP methyl ester carboxylesterase